MHYPNLWAHENELAELVTSQLCERSIVATILFVFGSNKLALRKRN
jgi:hypothetical protein